MLYRQEALASLGNFVDSREDCNMYSQVLEITVPVIQACSDDSTEMDVDSTSGGSSSKLVYIHLLFSCTIPADSIVEEKQHLRMPYQH